MNTFLKNSIHDAYKNNMYIIYNDIGILIASV